MNKINAKERFETIESLMLKTNVSQSPFRPTNQVAVIIATGADKYPNAE
ncbi:hypothetical protein [Phocaeicola plebeius]